jgi:hypothetical protein
MRSMSSGTMSLVREFVYISIPFESRRTIGLMEFKRNKALTDVVT